MKVKSNGFKNVDEIIQKRFPIIDDLLHPERDPLLAGLDDAVGVAKDNLERPIFVIGDYDVDGITSCAILHNAFKIFWHKDPVVRIPKRMSEGYGLNMTIVDEILGQADQPALIFTVDNGIVANKQVAALKAKGHAVIIIDHHLPAKDGILPEADAILDPKAVQGSDFDGYCGAGLSLRFIKALAASTKTDKHPLWEMQLRKMTAMAALGTIADSVPMIDDNRNIVVDGLVHINNRAVTAGMFVLMRAMKLETVNEKDIGFYLAPALNAIGRLKDDGAMDAFNLISKDKDTSDLAPGKVLTEAMVDAKVLVDANERRKTMVQEAVREFDKTVDNSCGAPIVVCNEELHEGIIGIIAGKLAEEYHVPAFVFTRSGDLLKGSARTYGDVNIKEAMDACADFFEKYGGHAAAAGMSIKKENLDKLTEALRDYMKNIEIDDSLYYDLEITADKINETFEDVKKYAPYGADNPEPVILINGFKVKNYRNMGKTGQHLKLSGENNDVLVFDGASKWKVNDNDDLNVIGTLSGNTFRGEFRVQAEASFIWKEETNGEI